VIILLGLMTAVILAVFGLVFLAAAKAESWLALVLFAVCAVAVMSVPLAGWFRYLASGSDIAIVAGVGLIGGSLGLWILHRAGITERLVEMLSTKKQQH